MRVRLLGTAAGGAFPQWNCNCANCRLARSSTGRAIKRTQSCIAVSADDKRWFLINASPDVRVQIEAFPPLLAPSGSIRGSGIAGVLLTNADLDHTLGLLTLREGSRLIVHCTSSVRASLLEGLNIQAILNSYCGVEWRDPPPVVSQLRNSEGLSSGLEYAAFAVPGKPPRYRKDKSHSSDDAVGYRFVDQATGGRLVVIPDLAELNEAILKQIAAADILFVDGTFFTEDEMQLSGAGSALARQMGHLPVGGKHGSLAQIAKLTHVKRVYVHINNTNPMLIEDSPERAEVESAGVIVGADGMEFSC